MKLLIPLIFLVAIFSSPLMSQTSLGGKLTDGETGEELIAANIAMYKDGVFITGTTTDFNGNYNLKVDPGSYDVEASYVGYQAVRINRVIVRAGQANRLNIAFGIGVVGDNFKGRTRRNVRKRRVSVPVPKEEHVVKEVLDNGPEGGS